MAPRTDSSVTDYYRSVAAVLLRHLAGHPVHRVGPESSTGAGSVALTGSVTVTADSAAAGTVEPPADIGELMALVGSGVAGFAATPACRLVLRLTPGEGSDIATAATAALQVSEQCRADGLRPVPLTDGTGGLWLMARVEGNPAAAATRYLRLLTDAAPELATADAGAADGRTLVTIHCGPGTGPVPLPYTLLPSAGWPAAVVPLHLDEVAAITAGMPAEIGADDVPGRIAARGDLASALLVMGDRVG